MSASNDAVLSSAAVEHLRWSLTPEIGPMLFGRLIAAFGSAQAALGVGSARLADIEGIGSVLADRIARGRDVADVEAEVGRAAREGVRILCRDDAEFPMGLRYIPDPPICLYVRGKLDAEDAVALAIVGSRRCTIYGREQAYRFGYALASRGVTVVSGLARGVDGESHKGAIAAGGRTIAVLGNGLSDIYPPEHRELAERVSACGAVVSELPMTTSPNKGNFLPRNRLIAGLSLGVLVVEAARRSGSLTTARLANEYNREVFAVPGRVDSEMSSGANMLIRDQHAKLVLNADDVLDDLGEAGEVLRSQEVSGAETTVTSRVPKLTPEEDLVYRAVDRHEQSIEAIAEAVSRPASTIASTLITLQLKGLVRQLPGNLFMRAGKN